MHKIENNLTQVKHSIQAAAENCGRDFDAITLLAVSKKKPLTDICAAYEFGQRHFGENYVQEGVDKIQASPYNDIIWHFIGPIQSNKTKAIAEHFAWVHSIDRLKIAQRLNDQRPAELPPLQVCVQINIDQEASKSGMLPEEALSMARAISELPRLQLRGLMAIPAKSHGSKESSPFARMQALQNQLIEAGFTHLDTLSMGMSGDLDEAIAQGSTMVRIGTAIFGQREA